MNDTESIVALAKEASPKPITIAGADGREHLLVPEGYETTDITNSFGIPPEKPKAIRSSVIIQAKDSLVEYVNRFKTAGTILFADISKSAIVAAIDYHGKSDGKVAGEADLGIHSARMELPFSEEWTTWTGASGKLMPQLEFARFIEENAPDIIIPHAAEVLEACRDLQARRKVDFHAAVRTESDNENFTFSDETDVSRKGELEVPTKFVLSIPVYFDEGTVEQGAFLRWRIDDAKLMLGIKLHRAEHVRQAVFKLIVADIAERTGCPAVYGRIEPLPGSHR